MLRTRQKSTEKGFTLIEMAIVIVIIGMVMAAVAQLYTQRIRTLQITNTELDVENINTALSGFLRLNGRYPCPASLTAQRGIAVAGQTDYGRETDCSDGVAHNIAASGVVTTADNVRIGTIPFKALNLGEDAAIDGYRNRYIYAVTEAQAVQATFDSNGGVITVQDEDNVNAAGENLSFVLYSTGKNGTGGYNREGFQGTPCRAAALEGTNCDFADSTFISAQQGTETNASEFDDYISYNALSDLPTWEENAGDGGKIGTKGSLGIGPGVNENPEEELDVVGIVKAQDNPDTTEIEGKILSSNLCENRNVVSGVEVTKCFPSLLIGQEGSPHPDMLCPSGQFMLGIANGRAECSSNVEIACPPGQFMIGVNTDGTPKCNVKLAGCSSVAIELCKGQPSQTLLGGASHGDYQTLTGGLAGNPRKQTFKCSNGTWKKHGSATGLCSCTAGVTYSNPNGNCKGWSSCGDRYTGKKTSIKTRSCPSGKETWSEDRSGCTCVETVRNTWPGCGWGYNTGSIKKQNKHDCTTKKCSGWTTVYNTCGCKTQDFAEWKSCPSGFEGSYQIAKKRECPSGASGKYKDTAWTEVPGRTKADRCTCKKSTYTRKEYCPDGQYGDIATLVTMTCPDEQQPPVPVETPIVNKACEPIPPIQCKWMWPAGGSSEPPGKDKLPTIAGTTFCNCGTEQNDTKKCSKPAGSKHQYANCRCEVVASE